MVHKKLQQLVVFLLPACLFEFPHKQCDRKLDRIKFPAAFLSPENVWNSAYSELTGNAIQLPAVFHNWTEVENWLLAVYKKTNYFQENSRYSSAVTRSILNVKNFVDAHYQEPIDSTEIARNAQMSYGYFSRCFHDIIGVSFSDYYSQIRISHAKELLLNTDKTVQEIAFLTGYNDEKYFSRIFKKLTNVSPSEFRKNT